MARVINHDIGETVLLVGTVSAINITRDDEVVYRVRIDGLGGDHWIPESATLDSPFSPKSESEDE